MAVREASPGFKKMESSPFHRALDARPRPPVPGARRLRGEKRAPPTPRTGGPCSAQQETLGGAGPLRALG